MSNDVCTPSICRIQQVLVAFLLLVLLPACNLVGGGKTTTLSLDTTPTSVPASTQVVFSASISHNNGQFLGANWTLTGAACPSACGTLTNPTNSGSSGNGDTATITYTAPATVPNPNSITITATSVENPSSSQSDTFTITAIQTALSALPVVLPVDIVNVVFAPVTFQATGGVAPFTWSLADGALPNGILVSTAGMISGTPTTTGTFTFDVQVQDSTGATAVANESLTVVGPPSQVNITGVTVNSGSTDSQLATVTTDNGSQIGMWGDKDSNGMVTALRSIALQTPGATPTTSTFTMDGSGNLVQFQPGDGTVFNLTWQNATTATVVAYTADGTAIIGPVQITVPPAASAAKARQHTVMTRAAGGLPPSPPNDQNDFQVQVTHCGKPAEDAAVSLQVTSPLFPTARFLNAEQTVPLGTYYAQIPVVIPGSVVASTVSYCDSAADWVGFLYNQWTSTKNAISTTCTVMTTAAVVSSLVTGPAGLAIAAEIETACGVALDSWLFIGGVAAVTSPQTPPPPSPLRAICDKGVPYVADLINDTIVFIQATATIPGQPASISQNLAYAGQGPFGSITINFDTGGACDIQGNWNGGWSRVDGQGEIHAGALGAAISDSIATTGVYDVALTVTDSNGSTNYTFTGEPTGEDSTGTFFNFGPAVIDGVTGTAEGYLTPDGRALSGSYVGNTSGAIGGFSMVKQ